jgi:signal transduction histidine kinase/CheY-like chemotaxis protein
MFSICYALIGELGMLLRVGPSMVATYWPAAGFGAAAACFCRRAQWRKLLVAMFVGCVLGDLRHDPVIANVGYAVANSAEAFGFAFVMQYWYSRWRTSHTNTAVRIPAMFVVGLIATTASAFIGVTVTNLSFDGDYLAQLRTWIAGDLTGISLVLPIASHITLRSQRTRRMNAELAIATTALVGVSVLLTFGSTAPHVGYVHYLVLPPLVWTAIRVGPKETSIAVAVFGGLLMIGTAHGFGPWAAGAAVSDGEVFAAQVFLIAVVLTAMGVARSTEDRRMAALRQLETERALSERELEVAALAADRERQRLESQLLHSQRLEALGRLAGGVAHDFNNLLGVIRNYASLVSRHPDLTAELRSDVQHIEHAAGRGAELTRELLLFSRGDPEAGGTADAALVARTVVRLLSRSLGATIDLRLAVAGSTHAKISSARLEQALINLVINARDAIVGSGLIDIVVSGQGDTVAVSVADTGSGMSPEIVERVFEPFFTTKGPGEGSGLGLSTVYGIVERAGGRVRIDSTPGRGTTVTLELLVAARDLDEPRTLNAIDDEGIVAVVDDDRDLLALTVRLLEAEGIDAVGFGSGAEMLAATARAGTAPRVLVTDVVMPALTGPQLADQLWRRFPNLPVVFVSGYAPPDSVHLDDVRATFLAKPFDAAQLAAAIRAREASGAPSLAERQRTPDRSVQVGAN